MGLIIDTSTLVTAERRGHGVADILEQIQRVCGEARAGVSVVTIVELSHGIERAGTEAKRQRRQTFLAELRAAMTMHPQIKSRSVPAQSPASWHCEALSFPSRIC